MTEKRERKPAVGRLGGGCQMAGQYSQVIQGNSASCVVDTFNLSLAGVLLVNSLFDPVKQVAVGRKRSLEGLEVAFSVAENGVYFFHCFLFELSGLL